MASADLERFLQAIVDDHALASGIKPLASDIELVQFACRQGFEISLSEWGRHVAMDRLQQSDDELELSLRADPSHWSWAFRQTARWRSLLMAGAQVQGVVAAPAPTSAADGPGEMDASQKDSALESFIAKARQDPALRDRIKFARNQDEVLDLAQQQGFAIDSLTILRRWSQHSDFSKPTWFGWFEE